jgi:branched-chain amino acid transport system permease protein
LRPPATTAVERVRALGSAPFAPAFVVTAALVVAVVALQGSYYDGVLVLAVAYAVVTVGMAVQIGYSNQLAFSQSVFMGIGAYGVALLNTRYGWATPLALVAVVAGCGVLGTLVGSVVTRAPGLALALATILFPIPVTTYVTYSDFLGGYTGIGGIDPLWAGDTAEDGIIRSGIVAVILLGICLLVCGRILRSGIGLELALSSDERTSGALGILTSRRKLELYVLGSMLAALGGALFASTQVVVSSDVFSQATELTLLVMLFVGGRRSLVGAVVGAIGIEYLSGSTTLINTHLLVIQGVLLTVVLLFEPEGIAGIAGRVAGALARRLGEAPAVESVTPAGTGPVTIAAAGDGLGRGGRPDAPVLDCRGLSRRFGGLVAVDGVSLRIPERGLYGICGPNGAGKTTLLELIAGGLASDAGTVLLEGQDVTRRTAAQRAQLGVARTFQTVRLLRHRSALDNVAVACLPSHRTPMVRALIRSDLAGATACAREALARAGIGDLSHDDPGRFTLEGQRMVELARAIAARPRLLLLDEPASGLSGAQRGRLADLLVRMGEEMTILVVEHDLELLATIARRLFVMIDGRLRFEGDPGEFRTSSLVRTELMGLVGDYAASGG